MHEKFNEVIKQIIAKAKDPDESVNPFAEKKSVLKLANKIISTNNKN